MVNISSIVIDRTEEHTRISAFVSMPDLEGEAWYVLPPGAETDQDAATDAFFIIGLILAMGSDGQLTMSNAASQRLLYSSVAVQDILLGWYPTKLKRATLAVPRREAESPPVQDATITCFTGGVDSFHSFLTNQEDIDALLYMHGFDIPLARTEIREATSLHLQDVAQSTGKELIEGSTNVRKFLNRAGTWPGVTHGAALSSVGHLLRRRFGRLIIPATHTYADTYPWGSHPLLDHRWSSGALDVVHDGAGATRVAKTKRLANDPVARKHLRVCWQNTGDYNCGECAKCVRTKIALSLAGVLPDFETFDGEVSLDAIRRLGVSGRSDESFVLENLAFAREQGNDEISEVLQKMVADYREKKLKATARRLPVTTDPSSPSNSDLAKRLKEVESSLTKRIAASEREIRRVRGMMPLRAWRRFESLIRPFNHRR